MKNLILVTSLLIIKLIGYGQSASTHLESLVKYSMPNENCMQIPSSFANKKVDSKLKLPFTGEKKITQIDLVYTRYKTNPQFDQVKLNEARIVQLKNKYPQLVADNPQWNWIEQTGATTAEEGKDYFHGFVIHYVDPAPFHELKTFLNDQGNPPNKIVVDNKKGGDFTQTSGSILHVPANCVIYKNGKPVVGSYDLEYTEYRNAAEIAFSGLPMTYSDQQENYNFNSMGMYEIRGSQNGIELELTKPIIVDFNCTEIGNDVSFFELNDQSGEWKKNQPIVFGNELKSTNRLVTSSEIQTKFMTNPSTKATIETTHGPTKSISTFSETAWNYYLELKKNNPKFVELAVINEDTEKRQVEVWKESANELTQKILEIQTQFPLMEALMKNDLGSTLLADGSRDPGHTYPALVKGLNSPSFGVYNCDQIFRIGEQISLRPTYIDGETGKEITGAKVACVINLKINGSFSFDPRQLNYNPNAQNVILLFASDNRIYALSDSQLKALHNTSGKATLAMTNITATVKTSDDLKNYLGL